MNYQSIFKRYEIKYLLSDGQKAAVFAAIRPHMQPDQYGRTTICNVYFDNDSYRLIRRSLEKPSYKEKLRLRSYGVSAPGAPVFAELKKKFDGVVYKRRLTLPEDRVLQALESGAPLPVQSQIASEIDWFRDFYGPLQPKVYLSYDREAWYDPHGSDLRITFDDNILYRTEDLSLCTPPRGKSLLTPGQTLMEIKTAVGIPLWLTRALTANHIFKTSYSKYGNAYLDMVKKGALPHV